jgi:mannosyl-oligosaccharide glucosidase
MLSKAGIRSLSKKDQFYLYRSNYWRGAVWINVNYLVLRGIFKNYIDITDFDSYFDTNDLFSINSTPSIGNARELYQTIRYRLISAVYKNWIINHVFWE